MTDSSPVGVDVEFYLDRYPDVKNAGWNAEEHYAKCGKYEGRFPNKDAEKAAFDGEAYLRANPDVKAAGMAPYQHYIDYGRLEGRKFTRIAPAPIVDSEYYFSAYPDVEKAGFKADEHYNLHGKYEGRFPNAKEESACFDGDDYLRKHPDVKAAGLDPYVHFHKWGRAEKRAFSLKPVTKECIHRYRSYYTNAQFCKTFDTNAFMDMYPSLIAFCARHNISPFEYFKNRGKKMGYLPNFETLSNTQKKHVVYSKSFSIIVPVYNSKEFLTTCLASAYAQTVPNLEVIIVDDGSTDGSDEIIREFERKHPTRTKVIVHTQNQGLVKTHADGISAATGDYFAILDGDDWLSPCFCEIMGEVALACDVTSVVCQWTRPSVYTAPSARKENVRGLKVIRNELVEKSIGNWSCSPNIHYGLNRKLYKRSAWNVNMELSMPYEILYWEDAVVTSRFYRKESSVGLIDNQLYHWFHNNQSVGSGILKEKYIDDGFLVLNILKGECNEALFNRNVRNIFCREFITRLKDIEDQPEYKRYIILYFAGKYDLNANLFSEENKSTLFIDIIEQYASTFTKEDVEEFVLFVDAIGQPLIQRHYLKYLEANAPFKFEYIQSCDTDGMQARLSRVKLGCTCRVIVTDGGWSRKEFYTRRPLIQLWHGMGAVKKAAPLPLSFRPQLGFCSSPSIVPIFAKLFVLPNDKVLPCGAIEADDFLDENNIALARANVLAQYPQLKGKNVYMWGPTFRGISPNCYLQDELDFEQLNSLLGDDEVLLVKYHPAIQYYQKERYDIGQYDKILNMTAYPNIYELMCVADVFMTDYSSAMHYAVLLNKPIVYLITDWDKYRQSVGLLLELDTLPGAILNDVSTSRLIEALRTATSDSAAFQKFKKHHLDACKGNSRALITQEIHKFFCQKKDNNE